MASFASLAVLSTFFLLVYPGDYRHEATWLAFVIAMYWICWGPNRTMRERATPLTNRRGFALVRGVGFALFLVLLGVQATLGLADLAFATIVGTPESRARDFADLVSQRPDLKDAILIGEPDYMLEFDALLPTQPDVFRPGATVRRICPIHPQGAHQTDTRRHPRRSARHPRFAGRPVVILLAWRIGDMDPARVYRESYV